MRKIRSVTDLPPVQPDNRRVKKATARLHREVLTTPEIVYDTTRWARLNYYLDDSSARLARFIGVSSFAGVPAAGDPPCPRNTAQS